MELRQQQEQEQQPQPVFLHRGVLEGIEERQKKTVYLTEEAAFDRRSLQHLSDFIDCSKTALMMNQ
jgi:hypothetical protein